VLVVSYLKAGNQSAVIICLEVLRTGMARRYAAFWSYTRFDDEHDGSWLSDLRKALEKAVRALSGKKIEIFQDVDGLVWGERWKRKLVASADDATFLIPIISPSYFVSDACRDELEQLVTREKALGSQDLILPIYYITAPQLEDAFRKGSDYLAQSISDHNYEDIRKLRYRPLTSHEARQKIDDLANALIERLNGVARAQLTFSMRAAITAPRGGTPVPRQALVVGTLDGISDLLDTWLVVETGSGWHPQVRLPRGAATFQGVVSIGRAGHDNGGEFTIHIVAVTEDVTSSFEQYRKDAAVLKNWPGVPIPSDKKVVATVRVRRNDSASMYSFLEGDYDEYRADGSISGGTIKLKVDGADAVSTEARNNAGNPEWTGTITFTASGTGVSGVGTYSYNDKSDSGQHEVVLENSSCCFNVVGRNTSRPNGRVFNAIWKRRT
jgi:hypothetical protein